MSDMDEHTKSAWEALQQLRGFEIESLRRSKELGEGLNFKEVVKVAERIVEAHSRITESVLETLPERHVKEIQKYSERTLREFEFILLFNPKRDDSHEIYEMTIDRIEKLYSSILSANSYLAAFTIANYERLDDDRANLNKMTDEIESFHREGAQKLNEKLDEASNILKVANEAMKEANEAMREAKGVAAQAGVSHQAKYFGREAAKHEDSAKKWLWAALAVAALIVISIIAFELIDTDSLDIDNNASVFIYISSRIIVYSVLVYLLLFCGKSYSSNRHNAIVNRHRHNALSTYKALLKGTSRRERADIVLHHAASCIFSPQASGYARGKENSDSNAVPYSAVKINSEGS